MHTLVIVRTLSQLQTYLQTHSPEAVRASCYLSFPVSSHGSIQAMENCGIPAGQYVLTRDQKDKILRDYIEIIGKMGQWNGQNFHWWLSNVASKNRFTSPLLPLIEQWVTCQTGLEAMEPAIETVFILEPAWPVIEQLVHFAKQSNLDIQILAPFYDQVRSRIRGKLSVWNLLLRSMAYSFQTIWKTQQTYGKRLPSIQAPIYAIKSFVYLNAFKEGGTYHDPFFPGLEKELKGVLKEEVQTITVALGFEKKWECYAKMKQLSNNQVIPLESFLTFRDVFFRFTKLMRQVWMIPFRVKGELVFRNQNIAPLMVESLKAGGWQIDFFQSLHQDVGRKLAKHYDLKACLITYEGRPWERALIKGIQQIKKDVPIFGCQHSVLPQAASDMFLSPHEQKIPLPDRIITTGAVPVEILKKYGAYPSEKVHAGCALRYQYLHHIQPSTRLEKSAKNKVLVALCGVYEILPLVRYVLEQAPRCMATELVIRTHPVLPFQKILDALNYSSALPENLQISEGKGLVDDIKMTDVVLYWGSTVALESIRLGRPVIHFDTGSCFIYDPLFDLHEFKWTVNQFQPLEPVIDTICTLPHESFQQLWNKAREYVQAYHYPLTTSRIQSFVPPNVLSFLNNHPAI